MEDKYYYKINNFLENYQKYTQEHNNDPDSVSGIARWKPDKRVVWEMNSQTEQRLGIYDDASCYG